jgi:hypothetical protein
MSPPACARRHECARVRGRDAEHEDQTDCACTACPRFAALIEELLPVNAGELPLMSGHAHPE